MERIIYRELKSTPQIWGFLALLGVFIAAAGAVVLYIEHHGHIVTGMDNQIVWGLPHVFAIFLIVAASGALNVASIGSVFGKVAYKPMARLSALLAVALLVGGLAVLVLDLGRPDRLIVAMTNFNFISIFTWNILLYTGFVAIVAVYMFTQMARGVPTYAVKTAGLAAFLWRLILTTGTGSIFGWLVARQAYDAAIMAPLFIVLSFAIGMASFLLVTMGITHLTGRAFGAELRTRLARLLAIFIAALMFFTTMQHLTNLYAAEHWGVESFILRDGGIYTTLFWGVQVLVGGVLPMGILFHPTLGKEAGLVVLSSLLVIAGGFAQIYVLVIGGQAYPLEIFPGYEVSSSFADGVINSYTPSMLELILGLGGVALALAITIIGMKFLRILPNSLSDANVGSKV
ncbi:molybdopterin oxidoreductase [Rhodobacterales bacterium 52_120_T64]|nr:molybdopterin oxidoreductase [Rhodobacterales bacterium 52_120_T64]